MKLLIPIARTFPGREQGLQRLRGSVAYRAGEPAGQGEDVLGQFGRVEYLELGADDSYVDGEHVGGFGAGVQDAGVFAVGFEVADGRREMLGGYLGRGVEPDAGLEAVGRG